MPPSGRGTVDVRASRTDGHHNHRVSQLTVEEAETVRGWLERNEFEHVSSIGGESAAFGDRQDVWEREGTLLRLTRDRGQWWYDLSRAGSTVWLDVDGVAGAIGVKSDAPFERVAGVASSIDDRVFDALSDAVRHSP
jgi:hypothetical protein